MIYVRDVVVSPRAAPPAEQAERGEQQAEQASTSDRAGDRKDRAGIAGILQCHRFDIEIARGAVPGERAPHMEGISFVVANLKIVGEGDIGQHRKVAGIGINESVHGERTGHLRDVQVPPEIIDKHIAVERRIVLHRAAVDRQRGAQDSRWVVSIVSIGIDHPLHGEGIADEAGARWSKYPRRVEAGCRVKR